MFDTLGDAFGAGIIGGFVSEAAEEEEERLRELLEDYNSDLEDLYPQNIRNTSRSSRSIYDDSDSSEDLTEIGDIVNNALAFARFQFDNEEK